MKTSMAFVSLLAGAATAKVVNFTIAYKVDPQSDGSYSVQAVIDQPNLYLADPWATAGEKYAVALWDNGCPATPRLHFLQSNLTVGQGGQLTSAKSPELGYTSPGAMHETGVARQYVWALYGDVKQGIDPKTITAPTDSFNIEDFEGSNKLQRVKTINMQVDLNGEISCEQSNASTVYQTTSIHVVTETLTAGTALPSLPTDFWSRIESAAGSIYSTQGPVLTSSSSSVNGSVTQSSSVSLATGSAGVNGTRPTANNTASITAPANSTVPSSPSSPPPSSTRNAASALTDVGAPGVLLTFALAVASLFV